jgi:hypothetical protein
VMDVERREVMLKEKILELENLLATPPKKGVCVCVCERERESVCVCVSVCPCAEEDAPQPMPGWKVVNPKT